MSWLVNMVGKKPMTKEEIYDLAIAKGIKDPALFELNGWFYLGQWVKRSGLPDERLYFETKTKGVSILCRVMDSWDDILRAMGW